MITTQAEIEHTPMSSSTAEELHENREVVNEIETATHHLGVRDGAVVWTIDANDHGDGEGVIDKATVESQSDGGSQLDSNLKEIASSDNSKNDMTKPMNSSAEKMEHNSTSDSDHGRPKLRMRKERRAVRRSKSTAECSPTAPKSTSKAKVLSRSLNMPVPPSSRPSLQHPSTSSNSDWYVILLI